MIDPFHLDAYGIKSVNYNRDIEIFPVVRAMFEKIYGECPYKSPTDMGVNMVGNCIIDDEVVRKAGSGQLYGFCTVQSVNLRTACHRGKRGTADSGLCRYH
jgi:uncharacterized protein (UPF0371 family)